MAGKYICQLFICRKETFLNNKVTFAVKVDKYNRSPVVSKVWPKPDLALFEGGFCSHDFKFNPSSTGFIPEVECLHMLIKQSFQKKKNNPGIKAFKTPAEGQKAIRTHPFYPHANTVTGNSLCTNCFSHLYFNNKIQPKILDGQFKQPNTRSSPNRQIGKFRVKSQI